VNGANLCHIQQAGDKKLEMIRKEAIVADCSDHSAFCSRYSENHGYPQIGLPETRPKFKPNPSRIQDSSLLVSNRREREAEREREREREFSTARIIQRR